jgi:hypothetical protein
MLLPPGEVWRQAEALAATLPGGDVMVGRGDSMLPVFPDRTVIVVQRVSMEVLRSGMTVVFVGDRGLPVAHRLVARTARGWLAKGVANDYHDRTLVRAENYLGTVVRAYVPTAIGAGYSSTATASFAYRPTPTEMAPAPAVRFSGI